MLVEFCRVSILVVPRHCSCSYAWSRVHIPPASCAASTALVMFSAMPWPYAWRKDNQCRLIKFKQLRELSSWWYSGCGYNRVITSLSAVSTLETPATAAACSATAPHPLPATSTVTSPPTLPAADTTESVAAFKVALSWSATTSVDAKRLLEEEQAREACVLWLDEVSRCQRFCFHPAHIKHIACAGVLTTAATRRAAVDSMVTS